ncbi:F-box protein At3g07870-like [Rutidosis leptorrhynchoides]|uniref:F-box protein At3g07870-like n=1 Tax=Rutidosis leptorrhynchoides TaxID=125765 RepID=UPI003A98DF6A
MSKELPEDVIIDIMSRVPTRYILRFKCVCKSWYALFQNPNFISKHFKNQSAISDPSFLLVTPNISATSTSSVRTVSLMLSDSSYKSIKIPIEIDVSKQLDVCGSCNGLICLRILPLGSVILLWNPATRVFKDLPISPLGRFKIDPSSVLLGFGFDDVVKDYKVLRIVDLDVMQKRVEMYSLSTNSWREVETSVPFIISNEESQCSVFLNGKFHWTAIGFLDVHDRLDEKRMIVCFDICDEVLSYLNPPEFDEFIGEDLEVAWKVVAIKESLAVISWSGKGSAMMFEVWVMKEYGVWTKYTSFELQETSVARPLGCGLKGEFLLVKDNKQLVMYDLDSQRVHNLGNHEVANSSKVFNHVGSLISINGGKVATRTNLSSVVNNLDNRLVDDLFALLFY